MISPEAIVTALCRMVVATPTVDGVRVSTHVLYPSNGAVTVVVRGGTTAFVVSDEGGARSELWSSGIKSAVADRIVRIQIKNRGLILSKSGAICSPPVPLHAIPAAVMLVANASRGIAEWGLAHISFQTPRHFRRDLAELLKRHFNDNLKHESPVLGASNKLHKFTNVVHLSGGRRLLVDPVVNDPQSINARLVANLDVRRAENLLIRQIMVFDDRMKWRAADLKLLEIGASTVPFSESEDLIVRLAA